MHRGILAGWESALVLVKLAVVVKSAGVKLAVVAKLVVVKSAVVMLAVGQGKVSLQESGYLWAQGMVSAFHMPD